MHVRAWKTGRLLGGMKVRRARCMRGDVVKCTGLDAELSYDPRVSEAARRGYTSDQWAGSGCWRERRGG